MGYREVPPPPALRGLVECGWVDLPAADDVHTVLPDGCMDLMWGDGTLLVAGPDSRPQPTVRLRGGVTTGLRFLPGALPSLLGVPAAALHNQRVALAELSPGPARDAAARLEAGAAPLPVLAALARQLPGGPPDPAVTALRRAAGPAGAHRVVGSGPPVRGDPDRASVAALAEMLGCTSRSVHRRCLAAFGYGPAVLRRVLRFRRAAALLDAGVPIAEVAARAGYADQPHLSREVRALAGASPAQLASGANRSTPLPSGS